MNDYKAEFITQVDELIAANIEDRSERMAAVQALIDRYIEAHGAAPDAAQIERLTDYILREELTDPDSYKVQHSEYPFMSERQLGRRHDREVSLWVAEALGTDGVDHRPKKKRMRSKYENAWMDRGIRVKNAERKAQYKRDTAPGPVVTYNLRDTGGVLADEFVECRGIAYR